MSFQPQKQFLRSFRGRRNQFQAPFKIPVDRLITDAFSHPKFSGVNLSPLDVADVIPASEDPDQNHADVFSHPKYSGVDLTTLDIADIIPTAETPILESEVIDQYSVSDTTFNDLSAEAGSVICLKPNSANSSGIEDVNGLILNADWTTSSLNYDEMSGNEWLRGRWSGPQKASLQETGDLIVRCLYNTHRTTGYQLVAIYGDESTYSAPATDADNSVYRVFINNSTQQFYYSHNISGGEQHNTLWDVTTDYYHNRPTLLSVYRQDNGDGTITLTAFQDGNKLTTVSGTTGSTTVDNGDGTVTMNSPAGGGNGSLSLFKRTSDDAGGSHKYLHILNQLPANFSDRESAVATSLLSPILP